MATFQVNVFYTQPSVGKNKEILLRLILINWRTFFNCTQVWLKGYKKLAESSNSVSLRRIILIFARCHRPKIAYLQIQFPQW